MATICPYCNSEVSESAIEMEDGCCPECGAVIGAPSSFFDEEGAKFDEYDSQEDDIFDDLDEDEYDKNEFEDDDYDEDEYDDSEFDEDGMDDR